MHGNSSQQPFIETGTGKKMLAIKMLLDKGLNRWGGHALLGRILIDAYYIKAHLFIGFPTGLVDIIQCHRHGEILFAKSSLAAGSAAIIRGYISRIVADEGDDSL
tara:strand:- start:1856 stop:2170 length:315 start_codon:yes stop_codon:yes gene_type:complete